MKLVSFSFTKLNLEKKENNFKNLKIITSIDLLDIIELSTNLFNSEDSLLLIKFKYCIKYEKDLALLDFYGNLIISLNKEKVKDILFNWEKNKVPEKFKLAVFNIIFKKSSIKALQFEEDLSLPPHISLPSLKKMNSS